MENPNGETNPISGAEVLDEIASFIRRHLVCNDHQLTILTLWCASPYCHLCFPVAPYLDVRSPEPCCGKSLCLNLLSAFCEPTMYAGGLPPGSLIQRFTAGRSTEELANKEHLPASFTLLLDDCHNTFGPSERQPMIGLLNNASEADGFFLLGDCDYSFFGPKAFAGDNPLPRSLAARCIPILLRRPRPSETFSRYLEDELQDTANALTARLKEWLQQAMLALFLAAKNDPANLPPTLSSGQRKRAEPLIHIADAAGGPWPVKIRAALPAVFDLSDASPQLQMLWDVRSVFLVKNNPEYLATSDLLLELRKMESRPWSAWGPRSGRRLASHLRPFRIGPEYVNHSEGGFRAYRIDHFQDAWERYLPPLSARTQTAEASASVVGTEEKFRMQVNSETSSETTIPAIGAD